MQKEPEVRYAVSRLGHSARTGLPVPSIYAPEGNGPDSGPFSSCCPARPPGRQCRGLHRRRPQASPRVRITAPRPCLGLGPLCRYLGFHPSGRGPRPGTGARRGAEELTAALNVIFDAVLVELHRRQGYVIYFSGDAVTCWFEGDDGAGAT